MSRNIGLIILGASKFPHVPRFNKAAFSRSARALQAIFAEESTLLAPLTLHYLFDEPHTPKDLIESIRDFLVRNPQLTDVILYYCGHGCFLPDRSYYLALRGTKESDAYSGLILSLFRTSLDAELAVKNVFLILDCCFGGQAVKEWQSDGIGTVVKNDIFRTFPRRGTALILASSKSLPALAPAGEPLTMFTGALLETIRGGIPCKPRALSFRDVVDGAWERIAAKYGEKAVRPEIHAPVQPEGDISFTPLFINRAFKRDSISEAWLPMSAAHVAPVQISSAAQRSCVVILSESERRTQFKLQNSVNAALELIHNRVPIDLSRPVMSYATDVVSARANFDHAIADMCQAPVVIVDGTDFEPAAMLLLGIRSVVRRGVTIISIGGDYHVGGQLEVPFTIKDANLVSHSQSQAEKGKRDASELLAERIRKGLTDCASPWYSDLAVFDAIRQLPPDRRGSIPENEGFLVLCPFDRKYVDTIWHPFISKGLAHQLRILRADLTSAPELGVARSFELESPRVVSQAIYEAIRRAHTCIIDWTNWSSNVFFEYGVRLAVASPRHKSIPIIKAGSKGKTEQNRHLFSLFTPIQYSGSGDWRADPAFRRFFEATSEFHVEERIGPTSAYVYGVIQQALDIAVQPASVAVDKWLLVESELYRRMASTSKPVSLYPEHTELSRNESAAERERLLAIWCYLVHRHGEAKVLADDALRLSCGSAIDALLARHYSDLEGEPELLKRLEEFQDRLSEASKVGTSENN